MGHIRKYVLQMIQALQGYQHVGCTGIKCRDDQHYTGISVLDVLNLSEVV